MKSTPAKTAKPFGQSRLRRWKVELAIRGVTRRPKAARVKKLVRAVLDAIDSSSIPPAVAEVFVLLTSDHEIREYNRSYRQKDKATDVLSFPQLDAVPDPLVTSLGDLVISLDTTRRQAPRYGNTFGEELLRLTIHGILHLLGHDHEKVPKSKAARMRRLERRLFAELRAHARGL